MHAFSKIFCSSATRAKPYCHDYRQCSITQAIPKSKSGG